MTSTQYNASPAPVGPPSEKSRGPSAPERRKVEWERVHRDGEAKQLFGGWKRYFLVADQKYYYLPPQRKDGSLPTSQWLPPNNITLGPYGGVDLTQMDRCYKLRISINRIPQLTAAEKLILHEMAAPVHDPPDVVWIMLTTLATNSGTDRQTVYRAIAHFEELGIVEWVPRRKIHSPKIKRLHPRVLTFRFLPGEWLHLADS